MRFFSLVTQTLSDDKVDYIRKVEQAEKMKHVIFGKEEKPLNPARLIANLRARSGWFLKTADFDSSYLLRSDFFQSPTVYGIYADFSCAHIHYRYNTGR